MPVEAASNLARFDGIKYGASTIRRSKTLAEVYSKTRSQFFGGEVKRRIILGTYVSSAGYYDAFYKQAEKARVVITQDFDGTGGTPNTPADIDIARVKSVVSWTGRGGTVSRVDLEDWIYNR